MTHNLKSLELQGYKTFATRTVFEFTGAITAIVGPNGSGKSNIADSIRWVLGEQSYALLRGKRTEDMIFSGSEIRSRASMASATVVFNNDNGWLPIDFSEVAVTRRAYRDGQNEYLINGHKVRLRDVSELLANSGLAERTYTIIGQGLVDAALALKAEDRRRLFEEAAGIGLYRSRREESLRRLEINRRNLERVGDILAELEPRLKSLEKQARRSQEYNQTQNDLNALLLEWYGYHWHIAQHELTELQDELKLREAALISKREENSILSEKIIHTREQFNTTREKLNENRRLISKLYLTRESISKEVAVLEERIRSHVQQDDNLKSEILGLSDEIDLNREVMNINVADSRRVEQELIEINSQFNSVQNEIQKLQESRLEIEKDIDEKQSNLNELKYKKSEINAIQADRKTKLEQLGEELTKKEIFLEKIRSQIVEIKLQSKKVDGRLNVEKENKLELEDLILGLQNKCDDHRKKITDLSEQKIIITSKLAQEETQLEVLQQADRAMEGFSSGVKLVSEAQRKQQISGVRGFLGKFIDVPPSLEIAITSILGENINSILINNLTDLENVLDFLLERSTRGILIPISDDIKRKSRPKIIADKSVMGIAADLIKVNPAVKQVVNTLLGSAYIVKDRSIAQRIVKEIDEKSCVATLIGEIFYPDGRVVSGFEGKSTVLGISRQTINLHRSIDKNQKNLIDLELNIKDLDQELRILLEKLEKAQEKLHKNEEELEHSLVEKSLVQAELEKHKNDLHWHEEELIKLKSDRQKFQNEIEDNSDLFIKIDGEIQDISSVIERLTKQENEFNDQELNKSLMHLNAEMKVTERKLEDIKQRIDERLAIISKGEDQLGELRKKHLQVQEEIQDLNGKLNNAHENEGVIITQLESAESENAPLDALILATEKQLNIMLSQEEQIRHNMLVLEQQFSQAKVNYARQQERYESLKRRVEDDFGLVTFEYEESVSGQTPLPLNGLVEKIPIIKQISPNLEETIKDYRSQLRRIGAVNPDAQKDYQEINARHKFLLDQTEDLQKAEADIRKVISELDKHMLTEFTKTFQAVSDEFKVIFSRLFSGGSAQLVLTDEDDIDITGIEIEARLPGRRTQGLSLLSGGERSLTATALIFALLKVSPTPFCILDEVDAMLDEANVGRFRDLLKELSKNTQFIIVTHNRTTVEVADVLYGVTMGNDSTSQVISLRLDDVGKVI